MRIELFVEPSCPFTWITATWLLGVADDVVLRPLSLGVVNEGNDDVPEEYAAQQVAGRRVLRVAEAARALAGDGAVTALYLEAGRRFHLEGDTRFGRLVEAVDAAGLDPSVLDAADDPAADAPLLAGVAEARALLDGDAASPVLSLPGRAFWGPILGAPPAKEEAAALLAAVVALAAVPRFAQLKAAMGADPLVLE